MPIYVYLCPSCGAEVEKIQPSFSSPAPVCNCLVFIEDGTVNGMVMKRIPAASHMAIGEAKKGSFVGEAIKRVKARGL